MSYRYQVQSSNGRRWRLPVTIAAAVVAVAGGGLGMAVAGTNRTAAASTIVCPDVAGKLPAVPAKAKAEVDRNLALLQTQIGEANNRLATSAGQGGPNFVQNAILGPLKDKRVATINRIATAIGRQATKPTGLDSLAGCALSGSGGGGGGGGGGAAAPAAPPAAEPPAAEPPAAAPPAAAGKINCPDVAGRLPSIPAQARDEVDRNLALLETQIGEANNRLATSAGQGGPNFVQNAILGPLADKRLATVNRIATAIGRHAAKPEGLGALAPCSLAG